MTAYGYEFYLLVVNSISHSFAALTREISSWPLEDKIHIHARACNILYILYFNIFIWNFNKQLSPDYLEHKLNVVLEKIRNNKWKVDFVTRLS